MCPDNFRVVHVVILILLISWLSAAKSPSVAVADLLPRGVTPSEAAVVTERVRSQLQQTGKVRVLERTEMDKILKEQSLQKSGACIRNDCAGALGKLLAVDRMAVGYVGKVGDFYTIGVRLVDVETGEMLFTVNQDFWGRIEGVITEAVPLLCEKLAAGAQLVAPKETVRTPKLANATHVTGDLFVTTQEPDAALFLDGRRVPGKSPFTIEKLEAGDHILVARSGALAGSAAISLDGEELRKVHIEMLRGLGRLKIFSKPAGAQVFLDGAEYLGETPLRVEPIPSGRHTLVFRDARHFSKLDSVDVQLDTVSEIRTTLVPRARLQLLVPAGNLCIALIKESDTIPVSLLADGTGKFSASVDLVCGHWRLQVGGKEWEMAPREYDLKIGQNLSDTLQLESKVSEVQIWSNTSSVVFWNGDSVGKTRGVIGFPRKMSAGDLAREVYVFKEVPGQGMLCLKSPSRKPWCEALSLSKGSVLTREVRLDAR
jgi:Protein of unknown function (DUF2380)/PEGA domain